MITKDTKIEMWNSNPAALLRSQVSMLVEPHGILYMYICVLKHKDVIQLIDEKDVIRLIYYITT